MKIYKISFLLMMSSLLLGCGGGGGLSSTLSPLTQSFGVEFTSFDALQPSSTVDIRGQSLDGSAEFDSNGDLVSTADPVSKELALVVGFNRFEINSLRVITSSGKDFSFVEADLLFPVLAPYPDDSVQAKMEEGFIGAQTDDREVFFADPFDFAHQYDYQTFGYWLDTVGFEVDFGVFSIGSLTSSSNIPSLGSAIYTGRGFGLWTDNAGVGEFHSNISATADFSLREITFSSTNYRTFQSIPGLGGQELTNAPFDLDFSSTTVLSWSPGSNQFSGAVSNPTVSGNLTGSFYGPSAEEIGGTFTLKSGDGLQTLRGSFGATDFTNFLVQ